MYVWGITDRGVVREQNQDAFAHQMLPHQGVLDQGVLAVVCDGMGGARAGNVASAMAVELFMEEFFRSSPEKAYQDRMEEAARVANEKIFHRAMTEERCAGMGTTLVAALVTKHQALILNEGDSRAYYLSEEGGIVRITRDHSLVEDLVQRGELTQEQAKSHPHKNLITRALGVEPELRVDHYVQQMEEGSFLLLCSDGLSNVVTEQEMLYEVIHGGEGRTCCGRLLEIALHRGAPDNVTALLIQGSWERED